MFRSTTSVAILAALFLAGCPEPSGTPAPFNFENTASDASPADTDPPSDTTDTDDVDILEDCSESLVQETERLLSAEPAPGFAAGTSRTLPDSLSIARVEPKRLELQSPEVSAPVVFNWRGPDLTDYFDQGEKVEAQRAAPAHSIEGESNIAVAYPGGTTFNLPVLQPGEQREVAAAVSSPCDAGTVQPGITERVYPALVAQRDSNAVRIPLGETRTIGDWSFTFLGATLLPGGQMQTRDTTVVADPSARLRATALGPSGD
jgi:hypothetical protein